MKRNFYTLFLKTCNLIFTFLITMLGFTTILTSLSCIKHPEYGSPPIEYKFIIKGDIRSEDSNAVIPNIKVTVGNSNSVSDSNGKYKVQLFQSQTDQTFLVHFTDVDGSKL